MKAVGASSSWTSVSRVRGPLVAAEAGRRRISRHATPLRRTGDLLRARTRASVPETRRGRDSAQRFLCSASGSDGGASNPKKVVLAYSGGLDTSIILKWLQNTYGCEVVTFTADLGQGEEVEPARKKAEALGIKQIFIEDVREEFVRDYVFPMFRSNAVYEGIYLLGTSIARPLIAKRQIEIALEVGADAVCHGATGKGNDQVRFELGYYALKPDIRVIAPWREWDLNSRTSLIRYAEENGIEVPASKKVRSRDLVPRQAQPRSSPRALRQTSQHPFLSSAPVRPDPLADPPPSLCPPPRLFASISSLAFSRRAARLPTAWTRTSCTSLTRATSSRTPGPSPRRTCTRGA